MNKFQKISVIIPAYNEGRIIGNIVKSLKVIREVDEIIVIDDCSDDFTAKAASNAGAKVISHPYNKGNGASIKTGLRNAKNEIIVLMDGDGQHDPVYIKDGLKMMDRYDMVIGTRDAGSEANRQRRFGNWLLKKFASYLSGYKIKDLTSGFRLAKKDVLKEFIHLFPNRYSYPTTSTLALLKAGYNVGFFPIKTNKRIGKSKLKPFRNGIKFIVIILRISTLFNPMKVFFPLSLIPMTCGIGYGIYAIIDHMKLPNTAVLLIFLGVIIFMMGLISEQISALRFEKGER